MLTDVSTRTSTMRLLANQVWKDLRLLREVLLAWVTVNLALHAVVLMAAAYWLPEAEPGDRLVVLFRVLLALNFAGFVTVTVLVVQADPVTTSGAFWLTRPVSTWLLLGSKFTILAALVVLFPLVTDGITILVAGSAPPLAALLASLVVQFLWLLPVMALAAVTTSLAQFVVACVVEVLGYLLLVAVLTWTMGFTDPLVKSTTIEAVFVAAVLAASAAVLVVSYGARNFRWAAIGAAIAPIAVVLTVAFWPPSDWASRRGVTSRARPGSASDASVPLRIGATYSMAGARGEVIDIDAQPDACDVLVREVGAYPETRRRVDSATLLNRRRGESLPGGPYEAYLSPFSTLALPVPQHLAVAASRLRFQWTPREEIDLRTWLENATLVVQVRR